MELVAAAILLSDQLWFILFAVVAVGLLLLRSLAGIAELLADLPAEIERTRLRMTPREYAEMEEARYEA